MQPPAPVTRSNDSSRGPIVLVGASVRAAAESARRAGFAPIAIDQYGDRETIAASDRWHPLCEVRRVGTAPGLGNGLPPEVPVAIVGGLDGGFSWLKVDRSRFWGADPELFDQTDGPEFLSELADLAAVAFPETRVQADTRSQGIARQGWLIKQRSSCGGLGVRYDRVWKGRDLSGEGNQPIPTDAYLQKMVPGSACGASFVADGRRAHLLGVCRLLKKRIGQLPFVFAGAIGPIGLEPSIQEKLVRLGDAFVAMSGLVGLLNVDVVIDHGEVSLLEVNPRWSASMEIVERSWSEASGEDCSMFDRITDWVRRLDLGRDDLKPFLKRIVFACKDQLVSSSDFDAGEATGCWIWKDVPNQETLIKRHEPAATMIARLDRISIREAFRMDIPTRGQDHSSDPSPFSTPHA
jgi:predicted ATP-grasp superfamily ATP-dependent carboligase